jgi:UDP-N-acetylmuramate dehydrogenase
VAGVVRAAQDTGVPWLVLGWGGNVLVPDEGLDALVLHLDAALAEVEVRAARVIAGGGAPLAKLVRATIDAGLAGLECLGGIPSTVGGALAMNAGAHGQEILDVLAWAEVVEADGTVRRLARSEIEGGYRWSSLGRDRIVTRAELQLQPGDGAMLRERARQARERRLASLPAEPSAGSVFRNPPGDFAGRLLEQAGCKGLRHGAALVSTKHANVIVNPGDARAADVRALIREMARRVREHSGTRLTLELKVLGRDGAVLTEPETV